VDKIQEVERNFSDLLAVVFFYFTVEDCVSDIKLIFEALLLFGNRERFDGNVRIVNHVTGEWNFDIFESFLSSSPQKDQIPWKLFMNSPRGYRSEGP
jgi:hypothetical protein